MNLFDLLITRTCLNGMHEILLIHNPNTSLLSLDNYQLYVTLHYITLHYFTLHYITLHYITLHYITLHYITLHYITLPSSMFEFVMLLNIQVH